MGDMQLQVGVKVLLKNREGKYLLLRRSPEKYPGTKGMWDIIGGRINPGTPLLDNLKREVMEETGLELTSAVRLVAAQDILRMPGRHVVRLTYVGEINGEPKVDGADHLEYGWFTPDELRRHDDLDMYFKELLTNRTIV